MKITAYNIGLLVIQLILIAIDHYIDLPLIIVILPAIFAGFVLFNLALIYLLGGIAKRIDSK